MKLFFNTKDALDWLLTYSKEDHITVELAFGHLQYTPQNVFQNILDPLKFLTMQNDLVWFTENDILAEGVKLPILYVMNPSGPATRSLVEVMSGDDTYVQYRNVFDTEKKVYQMTNRQFTLNSIKQ